MPPNGNSRDAQIAEARQAFRALHDGGCFVMPNPWDVGTAKYLQRLGFKALASTSAGYAFSRGKADGDVGCEEMLAHLDELAQSVTIPVNADFEAGFADDIAGLADNVRRCVATGIAGLSIEDATGDPARPLYDFDVAVDRVRAAIAAANREVVFTARSEGFICGRPDLAETVRRLVAFAELGADCLYAPGIRTRDEIAAIVKAVAPKPVNFLMATATEYSVDDLAALGVRRISLGGTLARTAWTAFAEAAGEIVERGRFDRLAGTKSNAELNAVFGRRPE
jgi:2-methylisocitrate lyase-like PEP mutase family enzyme